MLKVLQHQGDGETIVRRRIPKDEEAGVTGRPHTRGIPSTNTRGHAGRSIGNVAVPDMNLDPREAVCRKDPATT
ncbi:hypothetical protein [Nonomuraea sp. NPDC048916]|uniref:hypothetical protein n=1 Tax=Nonomuraea sp. NPDC048916 TaxID=3154232 RepID=UPI00340E6E07